MSESTIYGRVGITKDPESRKQHWLQEHPSLKNWTIRSIRRSRSAAMQEEDRIGLSECRLWLPRDKGSEIGKWFVYSFDIH